MALTATRRACRLTSSAAGLVPIQYGGSVTADNAAEYFGQPDIDRTPGAVFVYRRSGGAWEDVARLTAEDGIPGDRFGSALAVDRISNANQAIAPVHWANVT